MGETSLAMMVLERAARYGTKRALLRKREGRWEETSWQTLGSKITRAAQGLAALGFHAGDRLAMLAENRPEWPIIDLACLFLGGVDVPLYLTSPPQDLAYILKDAGVTFIAVSGREQLAKILTIAGDLPALSYLLLLDNGPKDETRLGQLPALGLDGLCARGERHGGASQPVAAPGLATIIYTSGTTGLPKGVMLTHANMLANTQDAAAILPITEDDLNLSFLPLSHGFERTAGLYTLLRAGASIAYGGGTVTLTNDLGEVKPTLLSCVPRVLELVYRRVWSERENARFPKHQILNWALAVGKAAGTLRVSQQPLPFLLGLQYRLADRVLFHKLRTLLGGRIRFLVSGGAPLDAEGFIAITGRKKDLIITSEGENIAPQHIEGLLKHDPLIEEACLIGDKRPYLTVLLVPNRPLLEALAHKHGVTAVWPQLLERSEFRTLFRRHIDEVNRTLPLYARVRNFTLLAEPFSQESGELTPTLKVKRREVVETRRAQIEAMYRPGSNPGETGEPAAAKRRREV